MFVNQNHAAGGGNGSIIVGMFVCLCLASQKPSDRECFVPARTDLSVNSLTPMGSGGNKKLPPRRIPTVEIVRKGSALAAVVVVLAAFGPYAVVLVFVVIAGSGVGLLAGMKPWRRTSWSSSASGHCSRLSGEARGPALAAIVVVLVARRGDGWTKLVLTAFAAAIALASVITAAVVVAANAAAAAFC